MLESFGARHKVRLAIDLHEHTELAACVNVASYKPFGCFARSLLRRGRLSLLAQYRDRFFLVTRRLNQRSAAIRESRVGQVPQFLDELRWNFHGCIWCTHPFSLTFFKLSLRMSWIFETVTKRPAANASRRAGKILLPALA